MSFKVCDSQESDSRLFVCSFCPGFRLLVIELLKGVVRNSHDGFCSSSFSKRGSWFRFVIVGPILFSFIFGFLTINSAYFFIGKNASLCFAISSLVNMCEEGLGIRSPFLDTSSFIFVEIIHKRKKKKVLSLFPFHLPLLFIVHVSCFVFYRVLIST